MAFIFRFRILIYVKLIRNLAHAAVDDFTLSPECYGYGKWCFIVLIEDEYEELQVKQENPPAWT